MRDLSSRCEPGIYAFIARGPYAGVVIRVLGVAWHHVHDGFVWRVMSTLSTEEFTCADSCLTPITGVDLGDENGAIQGRGEMNGIFAEYSTSVAFAVQLSKNQCNTLLRLARDFDPDAKVGESKTWMLQVGTLQTLEARGLVFWHRINGKANGFGGLTKAGELMVSLLQEAGLTIETTNTTSMIRRLQSAA